jgi:uncharacterized protein YjdB
MPFTFKLAYRLARLRGAGLVVAAVGFACSNDPSSGSASPPNSIASVEVAPSDLTQNVGETIQFTAVVRDVQGRILSDSGVNWSSSDSAVAQVTSSGLATAVGPGTALIQAAYRGRSGVADARIRYLPPGTAAPGKVTDLAVTSATDSSIALSFTETSDGSGQPAKYYVRYAPTPINWGTATTATRGTCASPLAGSTVAGQRSCTINGLNAATAYDFQVRAFRTLTGQDTLFGGLSNIGKTTTLAVGIVAVASIVVAPGSVTRDVGQQTQYSATLKDAGGNVLTGRTVTWSSSNLSVATVDPTGMANSVGAGTSNITASAEGKSSSSALTVNGGATPAWTGEPSGFIQMSDQPFDGLSTLGWNVTANPLGLLSVKNDPTAPFSPSNVLEFRYPVGYAGSAAPGTDYYSFPAQKEVYAGFYWQPSNPWENHSGSNINKMAFWQSEIGNFPSYMVMYGPAPYHIDVIVGSNHMNPNVNTTVITLGQWHKVEWHLKYATTPSSGDGIAEWWVDGVLQGRYTNVQTPNDRGFIEYQFSPTWGGVGGVKTENDYYLYDHARLSHR